MSSEEALVSVKEGDVIMRGGKKFVVKKSEEDGKLYVSPAEEKKEEKSVKYPQEMWNDEYMKAPKNEKEMWHDFYNHLFNKWRRKADRHTFWVVAFKYKIVSTIFNIIYLILLIITIVYGIDDGDMMAFLVIGFFIDAIFFLPDILRVGNFKYRQNAWWGWIVIAIPLFFLSGYLFDPWFWGYIAENHILTMDMQFMLLGYMFYTMFFMLPAIYYPRKDDPVEEITYPYLHKLMKKKLPKFMKKHGVEKLTIEPILVDWWLDYYAYATATWGKTP